MIPTYVRDAVADPGELARRVGDVAVAHDVLRVKGFVAVTGKPLRYALQGVGARVDGYYDRPWRGGETRAGALVVIGRRGLDRHAIAAALCG